MTVVAMPEPGTAHAAWEWMEALPRIKPIDLGQPGDQCPLDARDAAWECEHGRLAGDRTTPCGCFPHVEAPAPAPTPQLDTILSTPEPERETPMPQPKPLPRKRAGRRKVTHAQREDLVTRIQREARERLVELDTERDRLTKAIEALSA